MTNSDLVPPQSWLLELQVQQSLGSYGSLIATLLFDSLGWRGARLDVEGYYTDSEVADPLLGANRRISDDDYIEYEVRFRQDFPGTNWAAGLELFYGERTPQVRLDEIGLFRQSVAFTRVFVENKNVFGTTLRASLGNLNDRSNDFSRTLFNDRAANDIATREQRFLDFGMLFRLEIEGSF